METTPNTQPEALESSQAVRNRLDTALLFEKGLEYGENVIGALIVLILGLTAMKWIGGGIRRALKRHESVDQQVVNLTVKV